MSADGLTDADRADIHARLASWFCDDRQAFLVSHLAPVVDRIKADGYIAGLAEGVEVRASEFQRNALEMARKADAAERRAEEAEFHVEQLRDARDRAERKGEALEAVIAQVGTVFAMQCPPMPAERYVDRGAWMAHSWWNTTLGSILDQARGAANGTVPDASQERRGVCVVCPWCEATGAESCRTSDGQKRVPHKARERMTRAAREIECAHEWLDRPESDTRECLICGTEVAG